jgi:dTMP kinase
LNSMPARGKFIVLEGIDGSGKATQLKMLARAFASRGIPFTQVSFPRYDGFFGKLVARFLNGEFGPLDDVNPHFSALLYAGDRWEAHPELENDLAAGRTLLGDRYIASNLAHQGARVRGKTRQEFLTWLKKLEYEIYGLPREDLVIYLRVPPSEAHRLVGEKAARGYTKRRRDLQEANLAHLKAAFEVYDELARQPNWVSIECSDPAGQRIRRIDDKALRKVGRTRHPERVQSVRLRSPEAIHEEILAAVESRVLPAVKVKG